MKSKIKITKSILFSKLSGKIYKLNFAITSACNSLCKTCNVGREFLKNPKIIEKDLSLEEIERIFKKLPKNLIWLSLSGGEPFLRPDLVEICRKAVENLPSLGIISIPTNGLLGNQILRKTEDIIKLPLKNLYVNFSLDGPPEIHNKIRGVRDAYQKTWSSYQNLLDLSRKNDRLCVNLEITVSSYNIDYLKKFIGDLIKDKNKITLTIAHKGFLYKNTEETGGFEIGKEKIDKLSKIINLLEKNLRFYKPEELIEKIYIKRILSFIAGDFFACVALQNSLAIDSRGNILGNIKDFNYDLNKFLKERGIVLKETRKLIENQKCTWCWTPCEAYQSIIGDLINLKWKRLI